MNEVKALAFFDLDGTLLNDRSQVAPEVLGAMKTLRENHVLPLIATGRSRVEIQEIKKAAGIQASITLNGQYGEVDDQEVFSSEIPQDVCQRLLDQTLDHGHGFAYYTKNGIHVSNHSELVERCYGFIHSKVPPKMTSERINEPVNMMLVISEEDGADHHYYDGFPELTFYRNGPFSIDTISNGASKGAGIRKLKKILGYEDVPTYAFGDGMNDLQMFEAVDYGVAMGNAKPQLKDIATFVTKSNTDGGIVHGLKHFGLI